MKKRLRLFFIILLIFGISNIGFARRAKVVRDIYWSLDYSINKYGEQDQIIGAYCGQYSLANKIYINKFGMSISFKTDYLGTKLDKTPLKISFLFDSTKEITLDAVQILNDNSSYTQEFFISKQSLNYQDLLENIKQSKYMSILIENKSGIINKMVEVDNKYSKEILTQFQNSISPEEHNVYFEELKKDNKIMFESVMNDTFSTVAKELIYNVEILDINMYSISINLIVTNNWEQLSMTQKRKLKRELSKLIKELSVNTYQAIDIANVKINFIDKEGNEILGL